MRQKVFKKIEKPHVLCLLSLLITVIIMTYDFEKATRSQVRSQASHEEYIMRELRILAKSLKNPGAGIHI